MLAILIPSGTDAYSAGTWDAFLLSTFPGLTAAQVDALVFAIRKSIHFLSYGSLAWIWTAALQGSRARLGAEGNTRASSLLGGSIALVVAAADELNQGRFAQRSGSITDVLLDLAGILTFLTIRWWITNNRQSDHDETIKSRLQ